MQKDLYRRRGINPFPGDRHETATNSIFSSSYVDNLQTNLFDRRVVKKELAKAGIKPEDDA